MNSKKPFNNLIPRSAWNLLCLKGINSLSFLRPVCVLSVKGLATKSQTTVFLPFRCEVSRRTNTFKRLGGITSVRHVWFSFSSQVQKKLHLFQGYAVDLILSYNYFVLMKKKTKKRKAKKKERKEKERNRTSSSILGNAVMKHQEVFEKMKTDWLISSLLWRKLNSWAFRVICLLIVD